MYMHMYICFLYLSMYGFGCIFNFRKAHRELGQIFLQMGRETRTNVLKCWMKKKKMNGLVWECDPHSSKLQRFRKDKSIKITKLVAGRDKMSTHDSMKTAGLSQSLPHGDSHGAQRTGSEIWEMLVPRHPFGWLSITLPIVLLFSQNKPCKVFCKAQ